MSIVNRNLGTLQIGAGSWIRDRRKHYSSLSVISTNFGTTCVPVKRSDVENNLETSISVGWEVFENRFLDQDRGPTGS
jgi:hypothetical protein